MAENNTADRFPDLDEKTKDWLRKIEAEEIDNIKYLASIPKAEMRATMKMLRDAQAAARYARWVVIGGVGLLILGSQASDAVIKILAWFKGGAP